MLQTTNQIQPRDVANSSRAPAFPVANVTCFTVAPGRRGRAYVGQQRAGAHALRARQAVTGVDVFQTQVGVLSEMGNQCQPWINKPWFIMVYLGREGTTPIAIIYHNLVNGIN